MSNPERDHVMFAAGIAASQRGWTSPELADVEELASLRPTGPPVVVAYDGTTVDLTVARAVASLSGAGREVMLVVSAQAQIEADAQEWLPPQSMVRVPEPGSTPNEAAADAPLSPPAAGVGAPVPRFCGECGSPREPGDVFCGTCGSALA